MTLESNNVDITILDGKKTILIEIKADWPPHAAIRGALGQLLECAYYRPRVDARTLELVVIAPGKCDKPGGEYIQRLRTRFSIPISYCSHSEDDPLPAVFGNPGERPTSSEGIPPQGLFEVPGLHILTLAIQIEDAAQ